MGRPYGPQAFQDLVGDWARLAPGAAIGLDVLVGFPSETTADFEATRTLVASLPVTYLHVFPYSPRPGTPAARLQPLPGLEIRRRAEVMRDLGRLKKLAFLATQLGQVREVLVEGPAPRQGWLKGLSDNYLRVIFPGPGELRNRLILVRLEKISGETLLGKAVSGKPA
jgi:threonylcarbamoyladenosine tRNA methylthiotransferase MtaB